MGRKKIEIRKIEKKSSLRSPSPSVELVSSRRPASSAFCAVLRPPPSSSLRAGGPSSSVTPPRTLSSIASSGATPTPAHVGLFQRNKWCMGRFRGNTWRLWRAAEKVADRVTVMTLMMVMESESGAGPSSTTMVEYAAPPQEYNSSAVLHARDLAADSHSQAVPQGFDEPRF
ncbi:hypothetical protein CK203_018189 [Vitis vinifera]|uniref:Uncharacterized protein n=1 Tax=Vitis vinifera TaxID=29760 RepID=A0A438JP44_VITVI|nr:hypothetical protein CK203_018189 [Vitis vinifera]